jgi:hypothetical protein
MDHPDEDLPEVQISLKSFVFAAQSLFPPNPELTQDLNTFVRFVLAGRLLQNNQLSRVFVNAKQGGNSPPIHECQILRDFDSVIGVSRDLPYTVPMAIFPLASFRDTLTADNHLKYNLPGCQVCTWCNCLNYGLPISLPRLPKAYRCIKSLI